MVRGYERYYQKASRSTRDPRLDGAWSPSLDMDALGLRAKWWRGPYEGPDGNNPSAPFRGADAPFQPPQEAIKLGNTTYADRVAAWAYSYDCALFEQAFSIIFRNDTGLDFPGVGRTCNHRHLLAHMGKECKAGRCPKMRVAGAPVGGCVEIKILRRVRAESSRRPPRHRRAACSMAWRCRFLTEHPKHWLISTQPLTDTIFHVRRVAEDLLAVAPLEEAHLSR